MDIKQESEIISEDEINLYDYWIILVKRIKILLGVFFVPVIIAIIIALIIPRYYRGESEITNPVIPAQNIVGLVGHIDDAKKSKIFANNSGAIKRVLISVPKKSTDKVSVIIDAKTADIIPQAFKVLLDYIGNIPDIADIQAETDLKTERLIEEIDFKVKNLLEVKKANLTYLNNVTDMIKKRPPPFIININPADLVKKDGDLLLEIRNLEQAKLDAIKKKELNVKVSAGILGVPSITKQPSDEKIKQSIIITVILSLMASIFFVFFLDYIERMKERNNK